ncbi:MAG: hypothetical protein LUE92_13375 [Clostridiales bacterium]|nr:hypothetical protein [Clostridiales bacterium]
MKKIAQENHVGQRYVTRAENYADGIDAAEEAVPGTRKEILSGNICPVDSAVQAVADAPPDQREELAKHLRDPEVQRRGKPRQKKEDLSLAKQVVANMVSPPSDRKVNEYSMLETLRGVANTMIRASNRCFDLFPTLLTEQQYRERVIEIMQEPKNYILNIEAGGQNSDRKKLVYEEMDIHSSEIRTPRNTYQRGLSVARVKRIADHFDERIANMPKVSYRDGNYYVFDGQHTIAARKLLNGDEDLPVTCRVYYGLTEAEEALLFAQQFGFSDVLSAGAKMRALLFGRDPEALDFLRATKSVGIELDFTQNLGKNRIGCISTAFRAFQRVGEENYVEALSILKEAWDGEPYSLRGENVRALVDFVDLYKGQYKRKRLVEKLQSVDPLTIYRKGQEMGNSLAGHKKYLFQVWALYNGSSKKTALPLKF